MELEWVSQVLDWLNDNETSDQNISDKNDFAKRVPKSHPSSLTAVGKSNPLLSKKASELARMMKETNFNEILNGSTRIWQQPIIEARIFACKFLGKFRRQFSKSTWQVLDEKWINLVDHWTSSDHLCTDVLSHFPLMDERFSYLDDLHGWSTSKNCWRRRISLVTFVRVVRTNPKGILAAEKILVNLIDDEDYYVRKAIAWILREATKSNPRRVLELVKIHENSLKPSEIKEIMKRIHSKLKS